MNFDLLIIVVLSVVAVIGFVLFALERRENKLLSLKAMEVVTLLAKIHTLMESQQNMPMMLSLILDRVTQLNNRDYANTAKETKSSTSSSR